MEEDELGAALGAVESGALGAPEGTAAEAALPPPQTSYKHGPGFHHDLVDGNKGCKVLSSFAGVEGSFHERKTLSTSYRALLYRRHQVLQEGGVA